MAEIRSRNCIFRVSPAEYKLLQECAERLGKSLSEYLRDLTIPPSVAMVSFKYGSLPGVPGGALSLFSASAGTIEESFEKQRVLYETKNE